MNIAPPDRLLRSNTVALVQSFGKTRYRVRKNLWDTPDSTARELAGDIARASYQCERVLVYVWDSEQVSQVVPLLLQMRPGSQLEFRPLEPIAKDFNRRLTLFKWRYRKLVRETGFDFDGYEYQLEDERTNIESF